MQVEAGEGKFALRALNGTFLHDEEILAENSATEKFSGAAVVQKLHTLSDNMTL